LYKITSKLRFVSIKVLLSLSLRLATNYKKLEEENAELAKLVVSIPASPTDTRFVPFTFIYASHFLLATGLERVE